MTDSPDAPQSDDVAACASPIESMASPPSFDEVYQREFTYVWNSLRRVGTRDADIEDLAHEVFVVVHRRLVDFDATRPIRPWLFGIAYRVAADHRRKARHVELPAYPTLELVDDRDGPEALMVERQRRQMVMTALETIPMERRACLIMHDLDDHSAPEIAAVLAIPLNTVYSRVRVAREELSSAIRRLQGDKEPKKRQEKSARGNR